MPFSITIVCKTTQRQSPFPVGTYAKNLAPIAPYQPNSTLYIVTFVTSKLYPLGPFPSIVSLLNLSCGMTSSNISLSTNGVGFIPKV